MKTITFLILSALTLAVLSLHVHAVEVQQGQLYTEGVYIESSQLGLGFTIPMRWQGVWPQGSDFFVLSRGDEQASMFLYIEQLSIADLKQVMAQVIPLDASLQLYPSSSLSMVDDLLVADYRVTPPQNDLSAHIDARVGENGLAVAVIVIAKQEVISRVNKTARKFAKALTFKAASVQQVVSDADTWQEYMRGRYIVRYYTGSGYSEEEHIWLCSNGVFYRSNSAGGFGGGASGAYSGQGNGHWKATGSSSAYGQLILQYSAGETANYALSFQDERLYLDNTKWFRTDNQRCH